MENDATNGARELRWHGDALLLPDRIEAVEREQKEAQRRDEDYKKRQVTLSERLVWLTATSALVGFGAIGVSVWSAQIANRSAKAAEIAAMAAQGQTQAATDGIKAQKDIANEQIRLTNDVSSKDIAAQRSLAMAALEQSRDALARQLRPWVMVQKTTMPKPLTAGVEPFFLLTISNSGQGPALRVRAIESNHGYTAPCGREHRHLDPGYRAEKESETPLAPGGDFVLPHVGPAPTKAEMGKPVGQRRELYVWGGLEYRSTLTKDVHVTRYCVVYDEELKQIPDDKAPLGVCECHNEAD